MAIEPLYYDTLENLYTTVRIETADDPQTVAAVEQAVRDVRLGFFSQLGKTRALEVAGYSLVENPTTDEEILRSQGASAEALWLTILLMTRLPVLFMDNNAVNDVFNDEPLTRDAAGKSGDTLAELKKQLDGLLGELAEPDTVKNSGTRSSLNGPSTPYLISEQFIGGGCNSAL